MAFSSSLDDGRSGTEEGLSRRRAGEDLWIGIGRYAELVQICRTGSAAQATTEEGKYFVGRDFVFGQSFSRGINPAFVEQGKLFAVP